MGGRSGSVVTRHHVGVDDRTLTGEGGRGSAFAVITWLANDDPTEPSFQIGFGEESCSQMVLSATEQMMRRSA
jgi:hypothetical protein